MIREDQLARAAEPLVASKLVCEPADASHELDEAMKAKPDHSTAEVPSRGRRHRNEAREGEAHAAENKPDDAEQGEADCRGDKPPNEGILSRGHGAESGLLISSRPMIAGSHDFCLDTLAGSGTIWLASPTSCLRPPIRSPAADRSTREALFSRLKTAGYSPTGGGHLSHSAGFAAYLCDATPVSGLDLEWVRERDVVSLARFAYSEAEAIAIEVMEPSRRCAAFTELWVLKEAAAKALGLDLFSALARCQFRVEHGRIEANIVRTGRVSAAIWAPHTALRLAWVSLSNELRPCPRRVDWHLDEDSVSPAAWQLVAET